MVLPRALGQSLHVDLYIHPVIQALIGCCKVGLDSDIDYLRGSHMHRRLWTICVRLSGVLGASVHVSEPGICLYSSSRVTPLYVSVPQT